MTDTEYRWITEQGVILMQETYRDGRLLEDSKIPGLKTEDLQTPGIKRQYRYLPSPIWSDIGK